MRILTPDAFDAATQRWLPLAGTGVDFETNRADYWEPDARIVGVSLAGWLTCRSCDGDRGNAGGACCERCGGEGREVEGFYVPLAHKVGTNADPRILEHVLRYITRRGLVPYYLPFEVSWALATWGVELHIFGDAYVANRILHRKEAGLKESVEKYLGKTARRIEPRLPDRCYDFSEADADDEETISYCVDDAVNALLLRAEAEGKIAAAKLEAVYDTEVAVATRMAIQSALGYPFDEEVYRTELSDERARLKTLEEEIFQHLGSKPFSLSSGEQIAKKLGALGIESPLKTDTGNPSWSKEALALIADKHPAIPKIAQWRSSFSVVNALAGKAAHSIGVDGRVHPRWNPMGLTGSARFHCEKPRMDTLPTQMRRAFVAPPGQWWIKLQWEQPEIRMLASLSKDEELRKFVIDNRDVHAAFAPPLGVDRQTAKAAIYEYIRLPDSRPSNSWDAVPDHLQEPVYKFWQVLKGFREAYLLLDMARAIGEREGSHLRCWLNRSYQCERTSPTERRSEASYAVLSQSVATLLKSALLRIFHMVESASTSEAQGSALAMAFKGFGQVIPVYDTLYYCLDDDVPLDLHFKSIAPLFQLDLLEGIPMLPAVSAVGPSWGEVREEFVTADAHG